jgi:hypothetical protein
MRLLGGAHAWSLEGEQIVIQSGDFRIIMMQ